MSEKAFRIIYQRWSSERLASAVTHGKADYRPEAVAAMLAELRRRGLTDEQFAIFAAPVQSSASSTSTVRVLSGWRIAIFVYLLFGGVWFAWPSVASLAIHTKEPRSVALGIFAGLLFLMGLSLLIFSIITAVAMARNQVRALRFARLFCLGKIVYAGVSLTAAAFIFRSWGFTSPPEAITSIIFATFALLYLLVSRDVRAIIATT